MNSLNASTFRVKPPLPFNKLKNHNRTKELLKKTVIIIAGPTAVGKTNLAIDVAKFFSTSIISADSRQCYKELNIAVAKPTADQLGTTPHYFINTHSIHDHITAVGYEKYALQSVNEVFEKNDLAVMVGGTGLYIKAFCDGLDEIPLVPLETRNRIKELYNENGIDWLIKELEREDPLYASGGEMQNPQRMMRALEVKIVSGNSIMHFQTNQKAIRDFNIIKIALEIPREELNNNINIRVDAMVAAGLVKEAEALIPFKSLNSLQTVGYQELFDFFDKKNSLPDSISQIKQHTRNYAKRQMTWFKKDNLFHWFTPHSNQIIPFIEKQLVK